MLVTAEPLPMAKKKSESRKHTAMVRISEEARAKADHAARMMNVSLADYLTDLVMKNAPKDIVREARKLAGGPVD